MRKEKCNITITWRDLTINATYDLYKSDYGYYYEFENVEIVAIEYNGVLKKELDFNRSLIQDIYKELDRQIERG